MTDVFRKEYKALSQETKDNILMLKVRAEALMSEFEVVGINASIDQRAMALAKINLEQAVMWAIKAIT